MRIWHIAALTLTGLILTAAALLAYRDIGAQLLMAGYALCGF